MENWKKNITAFISGQMISLFGSMLVQYAITWHITLSTRSGFFMTLSILAGFLPSLLMSPFAGVWADRMERKKLIVIADALIALVTLFAAILFFVGYPSITMLLIVSVFRSLGQAIHTPAVNALLPQLVPKEKLMRVQGLSSGFQSTMMIITPILAAALLASGPIEIILLIDVITAIIGIFTLVTFVKVPKLELHVISENTFFEDLKLGIIYIRTHRFLIPFFVFTAALLFFVAPVAFLTPLQVVRSYGPEPWRLSAIEVAFSLGMAAGGFLIAAWEGFKNRIVTMAIALSLMGIQTIVLGFNPVFWLYLVLMGAIGLMLPFYNTPAFVLIQEKVDPDYLGRIFSVMGMISSSMMPIGMMVFGPLADFIDIGWLLIFSGLCMSLTTLMLVMNKPLLAQGKASEINT